MTSLSLDITELPSNRVTGLRGKDERETYRLAKQTLVVVNAPPSLMKFQPIPPSAEWQFHLAFRQGLMVKSVKATNYVRRE